MQHSEVVRQSIASASWEWYTWRDHVRAEIRTATHIVTLACPLTGGPVTYTVGAMRNDAEGIGFGRWASTGYSITGFSPDPSRPVRSDGDGYEFRPYIPSEVMPV